MQRYIYQHSEKSNNRMFFFLTYNSLLAHASKEGKERKDIVKMRTGSETSFSSEVKISEAFQFLIL